MRTLREMEAEEQDTEGEEYVADMGGNDQESLSNQPENDDS